MRSPVSIARARPAISATIAAGFDAFAFADARGDFDVVVEQRNASAANGTPATTPPRRATIRAVA